MNSHVYLEPLGIFGAYPDRAGKMPQMYLTTKDEEGNKKTTVIDQQIKLTTAINKGNVYPYNSTKRGWV